MCACALHEVLSQVYRDSYSGSIREDWEVNMWKFDRLSVNFFRECEFIRFYDEEVL